MQRQRQRAPGMMPRQYGLYSQQRWMSELRQKPLQHLQ
jgi:hypothetical protein